MASFLAPSNLHLEFEGASEMEAKALACQTISSDHLQIDPIPGGAILIVYDDRDGRRARLSGQCRVALTFLPSRHVRHVAS